MSQEQRQPSNLPTAESEETVKHMAEISDRLFELIIDGIQKKPETSAEALALIAYIYEKDISPLLVKLRSWALSSLKADLEKIQDHVEAKMKSGWCVPKSK